MDPAAAYFMANWLEQRGEYQVANNLLQQALASKNYFMFRKSAADLLDRIRETAPEVQTESPPSTESPDAEDDSDRAPAESNQLPVDDGEPQTPAHWPMSGELHGP